MFRVHILYLKAFFSQLTGVDNKYAAAWKTLYRPHTFRIDKPDVNPLLGFRYWVKSIRKVLQSPCVETTFSSILVFDGNSIHRNDRLSYMTKVLEIDKIDYLSVDTLYGVGKMKAICFALISAPLFFILSIVAVFHKNKESISLSMLSMAENYCLYEYILLANHKECYYYFPYENDANFSYLLISNSNCRITKVPGPNALHRFHSIMLSDRVALCSAFQFEQAKQLKEGWEVDEIVNWPLYGFQDFIQFKNINEHYEFQIGLISSGIWKRRKVGRKSLNSDYESEEILINWIQKLIKEGLISSMFVYLHPFEKETTEDYNEALAYYRNKFHGIKLGFPDINTPSFNDFERSEVTVTSHSSANLQRLFLGFKAVYTPMKFDEILFEHTNLMNVSFYGLEEFRKHINKILSMSSDEFFQKYDLEKYRYNVEN